MLFSIFTLALVAVANASPTPAAVVTPDPSQVYIKGIVYGGSGCPQGSLGSYISADRQTFTLIFDKYVASIGPGIPITSTRKNCQINLDLQYPSGFQYSIFNTVYRGYVGIDAGVTAVQKSTFYFSGESNQASSTTTLKGPRNGDYEIVDALPITSTVWSPCGAQAALNVNSQIRLTSTSSNADGLITTDSTDGKVTFVVGVQWQKC